MSAKSPKVLKVMFDEHHSESWTVSPQYAAEINPENPSNSSYSIAAKALSDREFVLHRNHDKPLGRRLLADIDLLVLLHPCDRKWERTTSSSSPRLTPSELNHVHKFVEGGGGLLVVSEYESDKYGNNLRELIAPFGLTLTNATVSDRTSHLAGNPTWVLADVGAGDNSTGILHLVEKACFYRSGACVTSPPAVTAVRSGRQSSPSAAELVALAQHGLGRVGVVTDSDLFGDEYIGSLDHLQLWLNLIYCLSLPAFARSGRASFRTLRPESREADSVWRQIKTAVNALRRVQVPSGVVPGDTDASKLAARIVTELVDLMPGMEERFPHQSHYLATVVEDLERWREEGFGKPNFAASLAAFEPQEHRHDGAAHFALFPMYTPNSSLDVRFEALTMQVLWPQWLADIQQAGYKENTKFSPACLLDFTDGYSSECAVLFPETVSISGRDGNRFGVIFCDREAKRYQRVVRQAADIVQLDVPCRLQAFLATPELILNAFALWDLMHDTSHSRGELPFDPFMVRQKSPFWMYGLEELRVDLRSFIEACDLQETFPFGEYVCHAVVLDRIFRFAVTGARVRNYDALCGQLLFTALHARDVVRWCDNKLTIAWSQLPTAVAELHDELTRVYRQGQVVSKVQYWSMAHDFLCRYMAPNVASTWVAHRRAFDDESDPKALVAFVHDDEFPLGSFHVSLKRKLFGAQC